MYNFTPNNKWFRNGLVDNNTVLGTVCRFYATQKKILELNPRHPLVKELKRRVDVNKEEQTTKDLAMVLFETATLRSNFLVKDTAAFAGRIERMLRLSMDISLDEKVRACAHVFHYDNS